jgi:hypothetical protein
VIPGGEEAALRTMIAAQQPSFFRGEDETGSASIISPYNRDQIRFAMTAVAVTITMVFALRDRQAVDPHLKMLLATSKNDKNAFSRR